MTKNLLMIHGVGCSGNVWDRMKIDFEAAGWQCEAPTLFPDQRVKDNPPESLSDLSFQDYIEAMSTAAKAFTSEIGEKPAVIGHSMGGLIAQCLAERGDVSKAVFLTPAQPKDCSHIGLPVFWTFLNILMSGRQKKGHKVWRRGFDWGVLNCVSKDRHDELYSEALYDSSTVYNDMTSGIEIDETRIDIPTLTIAASKDRATLAKAVRKVGEKYTKAAVPGDFIEYPNNAHWIVDEPGTDKVTGDIIDWLARPLSV